MEELSFLWLSGIETIIEYEQHAELMQLLIQEFS